MSTANKPDFQSRQNQAEGQSPTVAAPVKVFISYAHLDEDFRLELDDHLSNLQRQGLIADWNDRQIMPGQKWASEIDEALDGAKIILLLISARFMASNYCYAKEMLRAIERHEAKEAVVIPIILSACDWQGAPFSMLQALPKDAKPIKGWNDRDEAWLDVVRGLRRVIETLPGPEPVDSEVAEPVRTVVSASNRRPDDTHKRLPYLCDRSPQERELRESLEQHRSNRAHRPLLCVIHGDEYECHDKFIERLRTELLPDLLGLKVAVEEFYWYDPPPPQSTASYFWRSLGEKLLALPQDSVEECRKRIVKKLEASESPLFVNLGWLTENCERGGAELFASFLQFWEEWPELPANRLVICGLSLTYQRSKETTSRFNFWQKSPNERLRQLVMQLKSRASDKLTLAVLTELQAISRKEAEDWPNHPKVRSNYQISKKEITDLYRHLQDRPIAMEELAPKLQQLLSGEPQERK